MASFSGFIRKSPPARLRLFFESRGVVPAEGFEWTSEGRLAAFVQSVEALLEGLPDAQQDALKVELEFLATLADDNRMSAAEQVCAGEGIDLENLKASKTYF